MSALVQYKGCWVVRNPYKHGRHEWIENLDLRHDDVFIVGFPKSGITWLIEITYLVLHDVDLSKAKSSIQADRVPYIEYPDPKTVDNVNNLASPRLLKSHLPYHLLPRQLDQRKHKIIYVMRNAKDVSVSLYHFTKFMKVFQFDGTFDEFLADFMEGKVLNGPWWDHVASFCQRKDYSNILIITYEDMQSNLDAQIRRIAKFLDKELTDEGLEAIKQHSAFESLKSNDKANFSHLVTEKRMTSDREGVGLMRKGIVGDWKNYYSDKQQADMDILLTQKLGHLDVTFDDAHGKWAVNSAI